jgi:hypothetical protein
MCAGVACCHPADRSKSVNFTPCASASPVDSREKGQTMTWLENPQAVSLLLSIVGILFLVVCLVLISLGRVQSLRTPEKIKAFGVDLNVSIITILVLVGLTMSLTSTYMQMRNYEGQLADTRQAVEDSKKQMTALERQLARAGKFDLSVHVMLEGVDTQKKLPPLNDAYCRYYDADTERWVEQVKVNPGIALDYVITLESITPATRIQRLEFIDRKAGRTWVIGEFHPLSPTLSLKLAH